MPESLPLHEIPSRTSLSIYTTGPSLDSGALPSLFYFALSGRESLLLDPFNQPTAFLGDAAIRRFSFTLPFHGGELTNSRAVERWGEELLRGRDVLTPFLYEAIATIDQLIEEGYVDSRKIAAAGLSRGGFIATHLAAKDPRIGTILGFAPMTEVGRMHEWRSEEEAAFAKSFDLVNSAGALVGRALRYYIGNRDIRVGTAACFQFIERVAEESYRSGIRSPPVELIITPSVGHKGHGTLPHTFRAGADWIKERLL